jgi:hypothetical protein
MINQIISFKTYLKVFIAAASIVFAPVLYMDLMHESLNGDLTRIGFYPENDFGWLEPSKKLVNRKSINLEGNINTLYDVIVLGDSFSHVSSSWIAIFSEITGLKVGVFHLKNFNDSNTLITSLRTNQKLPKLFIYQSVERSLKARLGGDCKKHSEITPHIPQTITYEKGIAITEPYIRDIKLQLDDLGYMWKFIKANIANNHGKVDKHQLVKDNLFSNKKSKELLVFDDDIISTKWTTNDWSEITCNAMTMQSNLQHISNGDTTFVLLVAPDKSTIYTKFIVGNEIISGSRLNLLAEYEDLNFVRVDELLIQKVNDGERDIYWPNNTHWSYKGHALIAEKVLQYLTEKKIIAGID